MTKEVKKGQILQARAQWSGDPQNKQVSKDTFEPSISGGSRIVDLLSLKDLFFFFFTSLIPQTLVTTPVIPV